MMIKQKSQSKIPLLASCLNGRRKTISSVESRGEWNIIKGSQIPRLVRPLKFQQSDPLISTGEHILNTNNNKYHSKCEGFQHSYRRTVPHKPVSKTIQMKCIQITHQRLHQRQKYLQRKSQQLIDKRDSISVANNEMSQDMVLRLFLFPSYLCINNQNDQRLSSIQSKMKFVKPSIKSDSNPYQISKPLQFHHFICSDKRQVNIPCQLMNRFSLFMRQHHKPMQLLAIRSCTLLRILQWMQRHRNDNIQQLANTLPDPNPSAQDNGINGRYMTSNRTSSTTSKYIPSWDENFLGNGELSQLVELILACNYLGVDPLLMHATHYFGQLMAQRSQAEQSLLFGISEILTDVQDSKINHKSSIAMEQMHVHQQTSFRHHQCYHARV